MDGVGTPIIGRPRPLPGHDTPNPAYHPHTLNYEEPLICNNHTGFLTFRMVSTVCCGVWLELSSQKPIRGVVCINVSYKVSTVKPE